MAVDKYNKILNKISDASVCSAHYSTSFSSSGSKSKHLTVTDTALRFTLACATVTVYILLYMLCYLFNVMII